MHIQSELFELVSIWFNPVWSRRHRFFNIYAPKRIQKWNPGVALSTTHDSYDINEEDGSNCDPRSPTAPSSPHSHSPSSPRSPTKSHSHNGSSHVVTWRRLRPTTFHPNPVQSGFNPPQQVDWLNAHSIRFGFFTFAVRTRPMHIDANWVRIQCPVQTGLQTNHQWKF